VKAIAFKTWGRGFTKHGKGRLVGGAPGRSPKSKKDVNKQKAAGGGRTGLTRGGAGGRDRAGGGGNPLGGWGGKKTLAFQNRREVGI